MDRFNLQIQIAATELKIQKLKETQSHLEVQIAYEYQRLAQLKLAYGRGGSYVSQPSRPVSPSLGPEPLSSPAKQLAMLHAHLEQRGFRPDWQRAVEGSDRRTSADNGEVTHHLSWRKRIEYWTREPHENVIVVVTKGDDDQPTSFKMFLDTQMCEAKDLP